MKKFYFIIALTTFFAILFLFAADGSQEVIELNFSHRFHVEEQELACSDCHEAAATSTSGMDNLFPTMETCSTCHDVEDTDNCQLCHQNLDDPRAVPRVDAFSPKFSHEGHLSNDFTCETCHAEVVKKTQPEPYLLPSMVACMDCHEQRLASNECATCHLPSDNLMPASHTPDFLHNHSDLARTGAAMASMDKNCMSCHQPKFCQDCHEGDNLERRTHPLNFEFTHALFAQGKERNCAVCHTQRSFCIDCHRDNQILPHNHTPGWVNQIPGDGGRHRIEALNDLENCMACHEQNAEQICQPCHGN